LPEALLNCIALVGWSYDGSRELFTLKELEQLFDMEKLSKSPGVFDYQKLQWFNGMYIRAKSKGELAEAIVPFMKESGLPTDDRSLMEGIAGLVQERVKLLSEVPAMVRFIFERPPEPTAEELLTKKAEPTKTLEALRRLAELLPDLIGSPEASEKRLRTLAEELEMKLGDLLMPLRVAVTGSIVSPPLVESLRVMGVEEARTRAARAISILEKKVARS
jgi:glutamyl-tRNA synthetase